MATRFEGEDEKVLNMLRSMLNTFLGYHRNSMRIHGRPTTGSAIYADRLLTTAKGIQADPESSSEAKRWAAKALMAIDAYGYNDTSEE